MSKSNVRIGIGIAISILVSFSSIYAETVLNHSRFGTQRMSSSVKLSSGNFAVGWEAIGASRRGPLFEVYTTNFYPFHSVDQYAAAHYGWASGKAVLAVSDSSFFIAAFSKWANFDSMDKCIYVRKFNNNGQLMSGDIRVNNYSSGDQWIENVIIDDSTETIFVIWGSHPISNPYQRHYYMRTLDFSLNPISDDISVYIGNDDSMWLKDVGFLSSTKIIFAFFHTPYEPYKDVLARYMDFDGGNQSELFIVNSSQVGIQYWPSINEIPGGGVLIIWSEINGAYEASIRGRRFNEFGNPLDLTDILLTAPDSNNNGNSEIQNFGRASLNSEGDTYMLCWTQHRNNNSSISKLMGRFLDLALQPVSDTFTISSTGGCDYPTVLELWPNNFLVTWDMTGEPGYSTDIYGTIVPYIQTDIQYEFAQLPEFHSMAYPNPFNSTTTIEYGLEQSALVTVDIYDILGRKVKILTDEYIQAGNHQIGFNSAGLPSGTYFYRIRTDQFTDSKKLTLLK